jgi:predicted transcriptional regulator
MTPINDKIIPDSTSCSPPKKPEAAREKNPHLQTPKEVETMTKPLTKEQIQLKKFRRLHSKTLQQMLLYRFLHHYGYDKGEITAKAIIDDILNLIDEYFLVSKLDSDLHHIHYGQLVWMAVPTEERPKKGKSLSETKMKPVVLSFITEEDMRHIAHGFDSYSLRKKRLVRWVEEAFDQDALLTQLDLAALLGVCDAVVSKYVQEIQTNGKLLPTRGNIHDLSGAITHKREIITLYLEGYLSPDIAVKTKHSKESVDRYIRDYHKVETLWKYGVRHLDQISQLTRLAKRVIHQYVDLLPDKVRKGKPTKNNPAPRNTLHNQPQLTTLPAEEEDSQAPPSLPHP